MRHQRPYLATITVALLYAAMVTCHARSAGAADATQQEAVELTLPQPPAAREAVWLQVRAGNLARGAKIRVRTSDGLLIGTVSQFVGPRGQGDGTYTLPLPQAAIVDGRVRLRLEIDQPGSSPHAPKPGEVDSVTLIYVPVSE